MQLDRDLIKRQRAEKIRGSLADLQAGYDKTFSRFVTADTKAGHGLGGKLSNKGKNRYQPKTRREIAQAKISRSEIDDLIRNNDIDFQEYEDELLALFDGRGYSNVTNLMSDLTANEISATGETPFMLRKNTGDETLRGLQAITMKAILAQQTTVNLESSRLPYTDNDPLPVKVIPQFDSR